MGNIKLQWIDTDSNVSDVPTEPLPIALFQKHSETIKRATKEANSFMSKGKTAAKKSRSQSADKEPISTLFKGAPEPPPASSTKSSDPASSCEQSIGRKRSLITKTQQ